MPKVLRSRTGVVIQRPVADVFRFVAEGFFDHAREWNSHVLEVRKTSDGPIHAGATGVAVGLGGGMQTESDLAVLEYEPPRLFSYRSETLPAGTTSLRGTTPLLTHSVLAFRFESEGLHTALTLSLETDLTGYPWIFRRAVAASQPGGLRVMAERIRTLVETQPENL